MEKLSKKTNYGPRTVRQTFIYPQDMKDELQRNRKNIYVQIKIELCTQNVQAYAGKLLIASRLDKTFIYTETHVVTRRLVH